MREYIMPHIIEKLAYTYEELSEKAKQKAKDRYYEHCVGLDFEVESLETILEELGFRGAKIAFTGFWSQGDGASFIADSWQYKKGMLNSIRKNYPKWEELHDIAEELQCLSKKTGYHLKFSVIRTTSRYYHENTVAPDFDYQYNDYQYSDKVQEYVADVVKWLCKVIYKELEKSYDYMTSDESMADFYANCDYIFDENGNML